MTITVNIHEAKTQLSRLLIKAQEGEEIIIAKAGKPQARLVPIREYRERRPGIAKGTLTESFFEPLPEQELAAWGEK
jgi:prevent-host-death family protein